MTAADGALHRAHIALGSNLGDRMAALRDALARLDADPETRVIATSHAYETAPVGGPPQGDYLNAAAVLETERSPRELLDLLLATEAAMGRVRRERWGPRVIDLDLILYEDRILAESGLEVPHPRAHERAFVLVPLLDADPGAALPGGTPLSAVLAELGDRDAFRVAGEI